MALIDLIVANGCSFTAGGGLENPYEPDYFKDYLGNPIEYIEAKYMSHGKPHAFDCYQKGGYPYWKHHNHVAYPTVLEKLTGIKTINLAENGASLKRVIRTTYRFIQNYKNDLKKVLFIIEVPPGLRTEIFSKKYNKFLLVNCFFDNEGNISKEYRPFDNRERYTSNTIKYYFNYDEDESSIKRHDEFMNQYILKYFDYNEHFFEEWCILESLLSFFELHQINCIITKHEYFEKEYIKYHLTYKYIKKIEHILEFTNKNNLKINNFFPELVEFHPSLVAHELYANILKQIIKTL